MTDNKEYVERGALLAEYDRVHVGPPGGARKLIAEAPAADVAPVRHGKWLDTGDEQLDTIYSGYKCSVCGFIICGHSGNYCADCGAKMDGGGRK